MTYQRILGLVFLAVMGTSGIVVAADAPTLVFSDGSSIEVVSMLMERGSVVVELANGRKQQFDKRDVDLEASGLLPVAPQPSAPAPNDRNAPRLVMPGDIAKSNVLTISDQDVGHIKRPKDSTSEWDDEADEDTPETIPLRISGVRHIEQEDGVIVTGTVTNDGLLDLEKTTVTGFAVDADGNDLGVASVGLASALAQGASRQFSLMIPVTGEIDAVKVTASATEIPARRPASEVADRPGGSDGDSPRPQSIEDETSANNAG